MKCPFCENQDTKVIDSRPTDEGQAIRRRRECENCNKRFTTYEKVEEIVLIVIKKDGSRQAFDRYKIINGIISCLLYTSPSPRDRQKSRMPSSA